MAFTRRSVGVGFDLIQGLPDLEGRVHEHGLQPFQKNVPSVTPSEKQRLSPPHTPLSWTSGLTAPPGRGRLATRVADSSSFDQARDASLAVA